jgi:hypothetical protein
MRQPQDPWITGIATLIGLICGTGLLWILSEVLYFVIGGTF